MTARRIEADPNQFTMLIPDPAQQVEAVNPNINEAPPALEPMPPPVGPNTSVIEGWTMLNGVIRSFGQARSNQALAKLGEGSRPLVRFARNIDKDPEEAQDLVVGTVDAHHTYLEGEAPRRPIHYHRAQ